MTGAPVGPAGADALIGSLMAGDRGALARCATAVENETEEAPRILRAMQTHLGRALVVGFTGAPGAGKSTLVSAYVAALRQAGKSVGVVAVDPSSPISGGAILGDRIRMTGHSGDAGVFIRSIASRGHLGGLSRTAARVVDVMDASGRDVVVVETVGAGQSEVEIAELATVKVVVTAPGLGDDIQAIKAGILEIADVLVVNKADQPLAERSFRQLVRMSEMRGAQAIPVLKTVATRGEGIEAMLTAIERAGGTRDRAGAPLARARRLLAQLAAEKARRRIEDAAGGPLDELARRLIAGDISFEQASEQALAMLAPGTRGMNP